MGHAALPPVRNPVNSKFPSQVIVPVSRKMGAHDVVLARNHTRLRPGVERSRFYVVIAHPLHVDVFTLGKLCQIFPRPSRLTVAKMGRLLKQHDFLVEWDVTLCYGADEIEKRIDAW